MSQHGLASAAPPAVDSWQGALRAAIRDVEELFGILELDPEQVAAITPEHGEFPLLVPRGFVARMRKRDPSDPLLRQVLPTAHEREQVAGFLSDPLEELAVSRDGLLRKYPGRALLVTTAACPVHCRYCFRRHFPYSAQTASRDGWGRALAALAGSTDIAEIILSGGDPLSLANDRLRALVGRLEAIEHLTTLRIHSRFPIVIPERVDEGLADLLAGTRLTTVVVVHCNHPREIDASVAAAIETLKRAGSTVLNQSVLLRGVNDDVATLCELSRALFGAGVLPYYLHELDRVAGAAHFEVARDRALALVAGMRARLPGYLVPRLVREEPHELSKTLVA